jgi:hypothetical protein
MPPILNLLEKLREKLNVFAKAKKSRFGPVFVQLVKYPRRHLRTRAVVKSKIDLVPVIWKTPNELWEHPFYEFGRINFHYGKNNNKNLTLPDILRLSNDFEKGLQNIEQDVVSGGYSLRGGSLFLHLLQESC